jgi:Fe2+ or Zn2+ uptake regulation protein
LFCWQKILLRDPAMYHQINGINIRPISQAILNYLADKPMPVNAETIWLDVKASGEPVSIGSVYGHLNKLVYAGLVVKISEAGRKAVYQYIKQQ